MSANPDENTRGIVFMILAMGAIALADTLVKVSASYVSPAQNLFFIMGGALVLFAIMAVVKGDKLVDRRAFAPALLMRYLAELGGLVGMVLALAYVPLSTVGAITQASPILVAVGAVVFLGEKASWRRWGAIAIGFLGVLLIIQPGPEGFDYSVFWAILAMVSLSIRDLVTRLVPPDMTSTSLATYTMVAAVPFAIAWVLYNGESLFPTQADWKVVFSMIGLGAVGYVLLITSIRLGELSVVMPFRYSRIIFLLLLGIAVFGERPNATMLIGTALIIFAGIYMMWRERQVNKSPG